MCSGVPCQAVWVTRTASCCSSVKGTWTQPQRGFRPKHPQSTKVSHPPLFPRCESVACASAMESQKPKPRISGCFWRQTQEIQRIIYPTNLLIVWEGKNHLYLPITTQNQITARKQLASAIETNSSEIRLSNHCSTSSDRNIQLFSYYLQPLMLVTLTR